jgi:uncharacterized surface protein with fasciclin (FAS1) repeats
LPFALPEGTGGILLKTDDVVEPQVFHEPFTGTDSWILRSKTLPLTEAGKYYIVAFAPQKEYGKLWLAVGRRESFGVGDLLKFGSWKARIRQFHEVDSETSAEIAEASPAKPDSDDILSVLAAAGRFNVLLTAIESAGMSATLREDGPFTLFAPSDAAFARAPDGLVMELLKPENRRQLEDLLQHHIIKGRVSLSKRPLGTLADDSIKLLHPGISLVGSAKVLHPDIPASNGVVHVIDGILSRGTDRERGRQSAISQIEASITQGSALFNNGRFSDCVALYASTVRVLMALGSEDFSVAAMDGIAQALEKVLKEEDPREQAWRYREVLDGIYSRLQYVPEDKTADGTTAYLIDDFTGEEGISTFGSSWNLFTDRVMGGISDAKSRYEVIDGFRCLVLTGDVSLENNGGFIQVALSLQKNGRPFDAGNYRGVRLQVRGNGQPYYVHLRTTQARLPWQYYSASFRAESEWLQIDIPFDRFTPQSLGESIDTRSLIRIAIVGAKKAYKAEVAVSRLEFYR